MKSKDTPFGMIANSVSDKDCSKKINLLALIYKNMTFPTFQYIRVVAIGAIASTISLWGKGKIRLPLLVL